MTWLLRARSGIGLHHPFYTTGRSSVKYFRDLVTREPTHRRDERSEWGKRSVVCEPIERENIWMICSRPDHRFSLYFLLDSC
jgi:hypothetical protein